jgi:hypothetical protein
MASMRLTATLRSSSRRCLTEFSPRLYVDNDRPDQRGRQAGIEAAFECSRRWTAAGREVYRVTPNRVGRDLNDVMRNKALS